MTSSTIKSFQNLPKINKPISAAKEAINSGTDIKNGSIIPMVGNLFMIIKNTRRIK